MTGLIFQNQFENLKPSRPQKKTTTTCHLQKIRTISNWKCVPSFRTPCPMGKFRIFASFHASGASVQIFQGPLAGIFLQRWLDQVQPLLEGKNSRNFGKPDAFFKKSEVWLEMQYSKCVARGFHTVLSMKKNMLVSSSILHLKFQKLGYLGCTPNPRYPRRQWQTKVSLGIFRA